MRVNRHSRALILVASLAVALALVIALVVFPAKQARQTDTAARGIPPSSVNPHPAMGPVPVKPSR
jgi:hypothetical protein